MDSLSAGISGIVNNINQPYKVSYTVKQPSPPITPQGQVNPAPSVPMSPPVQPVKAAPVPLAPSVPAVGGGSPSSQIPDFAPSGRQTPIPSDYVPLINQAAQKYKVPPALVAAHIYHETAGTWNPTIQGPTGDYGLAQIVLAQHPEITKQMAFDPKFAIDFAGQKISGDNQYFKGDWNRSMAAYNTGRGGASVDGRNPYGGGPRGQSYINAVSNNLSPKMQQQLGIKRGNVIWIDKDGNPIVP